MATKPRKTQEQPKQPDRTERAWHRWLFHQSKVQIRLIVAVLIGLVVFWLVPLPDFIDRVLAGWNAAALLYVVLLLIMMMGAQVEGIKRQSTLEEESRTAVLIFTISGAIAMFIAIIAQLSALGKEHGPERAITFALAFATIIASWVLVQIVFAAYYAHEFHSEKRGRTDGGGIKFSGNAVPDYFDFLYFSFTIGTTNQTSDTGVTSRAMRRLVLFHGLLSFFFNTMVIALTVNLTAQLVQGG